MDSKSNTIKKKVVDYSLYLVTDSTPAILGDKDIVEVVDQALQGGVTIVQYRDKVSDTSVLIKTAKLLHELTQKYGVPLLINDRIDVALAVGCEGVHIGQDDMVVSTARKLLGENAIIGVTASSIEEASEACKHGADYLGLGTMFATTTKTNTKGIIGTAGTKEILGLMATNPASIPIPVVSIGGINPTNIQRVLYQSAHPSKPLSGVAIVSAIMASSSPKTTASDLLALTQKPPPFAAPSLANTNKATTSHTLIEQVSSVIRSVNQKTPLSHNMTNLVVQNFAANVALAVGGSPIMANYGAEATDLAALGGALVINMGTVTPDGLSNYAQALKAYNLAGGPVVFDPVGGGATEVRRNAIKTLMAAGYFDVIKGNEGEISTVYGTMVKQRGVDSGSSSTTELQKAMLVRDLARRERNIIVMTGATDYISDGERTFAVSNGHELLGRITGSGCVLGTIISCMVAISKEDKLLGALAGLLHYEIAAEIAARRGDVKGPGTFVPALIDELDAVRRATGEGDLEWLNYAKVRAVEL